MKENKTRVNFSNPNFTIYYLHALFLYDSNPEKKDEPPLFYIISKDFEKEDIFVGLPASKLVNEISAITIWDKTYEWRAIQQEVFLRQIGQEVPYEREKYKKLILNGNGILGIAVCDEDNGVIQERLKEIIANFEKDYYKYPLYRNEFRAYVMNKFPNLMSSIPFDPLIGSFIEYLKTGNLEEKIREQEKFENDMGIIENQVSQLVEEFIEKKGENKKEFVEEVGKIKIKYKNEENLINELDELMKLAENPTKFIERFCKVD